MSTIPNGVWGLIALAISAGLTAWLGPWLRERFELRRIYLAPFKEWSAGLYGELYEFDERYIKGNYSNVSDLQIIVDYRELHECLRYAPKWIGKINKRDQDVKANLWKLIQLVDVFWHCLENDHSKELPTEKEVELFEAHIKSLSNQKRQEIAQKIRDHLQRERQTYTETNIPSILGYLQEMIP